MKRWVTVGIVVIVAISAGLIWWLNHDVPTAGTSGLNTGTTPSEGPAAHVSFGDENDVSLADAGVSRLRGVVTNAEGLPVANAVIEVFTASSMPTAWVDSACGQSVFACSDMSVQAQAIERIRSGHLRPRAVAQAVSDENGEFSFSQVPSVELHLLAQLGVLMGTDDIDLSVQPDPADDVEAVVIELSPAGPMRQQVVTSNASVPVPGTRVLLANVHTFEVSETVTDSEGLATAMFHPGDVVALAEMKGFITGSLLEYFSGREGDERSPLALMKALRVTVKTVNGSTPMDARVEIDVPGEVSEGPSLAAHAWTLNTVHGGLTLTLPEGSHFFQAFAGALISTVKVVELDSDEQEVVLDLRASVSLSLTFVDVQGNPIDAEVSADLMGVNASASATHSGLERMKLGPLTEGDYTLNVNSEDYVPFSKSLDLKPGETNLEIQLEAQSFVEGVVLDAKGAPVAGASIGFIEADGIVERVGQSEDDGTFKVPMAKGPHELEAFLASSGRGKVKVIAPASKITIALEVGGVIKIVAHDESGKQVPDATYSVMGRGTGSVAGAESFQDGVGFVRGLPEGEYQVFVRAEELLPVERVVSVPKRGEVEVTIVLKAGAAVDGVVFESEGKPCVNCSVSCEDMPVTTDETGAFRIAPLEVGKPIVVSAQLASGGRASDGIKVTAPATGLKLMLAPSVLVTGRVVDARGVAVTNFRISGADTDEWPQGRFSVEKIGPTLTIYADKFASTDVPIENRADVGDVVLKNNADLHGTVVDETGSPVSGASVISDSFNESASTGADGRFSASLSMAEGELTVRATRGERTATVVTKVGEEVKLVLKSNTLVTGSVTGVLSTRMTAENGETGSQQDVPVDASGHFEVSLAEGSYLFVMRGKFASRVQISGARQTVTLGAGVGRCVLDVVASEALGGARVHPVGTTVDDGETVGEPLVPVEGGARYHTDSAPCGSQLLTVFLANSTIDVPLQITDRTVYTAQPGPSDSNATVTP